MKQTEFFHWWITDEVTGFPWLNRFSHLLEAAAQKRSTFASAPILGGSLDKSA